MQNRFLSPLIAIAALLIGSDPVSAAVVYNLPEIGNFDGYTDTNLSDTWTGNGYVGEYTPYGNGPDGAWAHLLTLENYPPDGLYGLTIVQVDLSGVSGPVSNATLSFNILDGSTTDTESGLVYGWGGTGNLAFALAAPGVNYGSVGTTFTSGLNSVDVTSLVNAALTSGDPFLEFLMYGDDTVDGHLWTYDQPQDTNTYGTNTPNLQLSITENVPEPITLSLFGAGLAGAAAIRRRRKNVA